MADELGLSVAGTLFQGWKDVALVRSMEQLSDTFDVAYVEDATDGGIVLPIEEGDPIDVKIDADRVIKGFVDESTRSYSMRNQSAQVVGRSVLQDLIDCSARRSGGAMD